MIAMSFGFAVICRVQKRALYAVQVFEFVPVPFVQRFSFQTILPPSLECRVEGAERLEQRHNGITRTHDTMRGNAECTALLERSLKTKNRRERTPESVLSRRLTYEQASRPRSYSDQPGCSFCSYPTTSTDCFSGTSFKRTMLPLHEGCYQAGSRMQGRFGLFFDEIGGDSLVAASEASVTWCRGRVRRPACESFSRRCGVADSSA